MSWWPGFDRLPETAREDVYSEQHIHTEHQRRWARATRLRSVLLLKKSRSVPTAGIVLHYVWLQALNTEFPTRNEGGLPLSAITLILL
jgi:hypothetical protein